MNDIVKVAENTFTPRRDCTITAAGTIGIRVPLSVPVEAKAGVTYWVAVSRVGDEYTATMTEKGTEND